MDQAVLQGIAHRFRHVAGSKAAINQLADELVAQHKDAECTDLCNRFRAASDAKEVNAIIDSVTSANKR